MRQSTCRQRSQRGFTLAEALVAMLIFTTLVVAGLMVYDRSNKVFKQSVEASDMQQSTRVAFDKLVSDLRLTGFDFDRDGIPFGSVAVAWIANTDYVSGNLVQPTTPNGHTYVCIAGGTSGGAEPTWPTGTSTTVAEGGGSTVRWQEAGLLQYQQPDEQIEYAGEHAITIRANFDYETETGNCTAANNTTGCENGREQNLQSSPFPVVTTGNDEIVTYALVSTSGNASANRDTLEFYADIDIPRDVNPQARGKEKKVTITGVDLTNNYPPYTLYRYTLDDNGRPQGVAIADNIRSLTFDYYTDTAASAALATPLPYGAGQYDGAAPDTVIAARDTRATIKSFRVNLIGMNPNQDAAYNDAADTAAPHFRKYALTSTIVPRNIGRRGMKEFNTGQPEAPDIKTVCAGACNAVYVTWVQSSSNGDIDSYSLLYDQGACAATNNTYSYSEDQGKNLTGYASKVIPNGIWRFAVQAINKYGSAISGCVQANVLNSTTPDAPVNLTATAAGDNAITLAWSPVTTNTDATQNTTCTDGSSRSEKLIPYAEKVYYRLYRSTNPSFNISDSDTVTVFNEFSNPQPQPNASGKMAYTDRTAGNCFGYYYRVQMVNYCAQSNLYNASGNISQAIGAPYPTGGNGTTGTTSANVTPSRVPAAPAKLSEACTGANCDVTVSWPRVTTDTTGAALYVDQYRVNVYQYNPATGTYPTTPTQTVDGAFGGALQAVVTNLNKNQAYHITVQAMQGTGCINGAESDFLSYPCTWAGGSVNVAPASGTSWGGTGTQADPWIINNGGTFTVTTGSSVSSVTGYVYENNTLTQTVTATGSGTAWNLVLADTSDSVSALLQVVVRDSSGCQLAVNDYVLDMPPGGCQLNDQQSSNNTIVTWTKGSSTGDTVNVSLQDLSTTETLTPLSVLVNWNNALVNNSSFQSVTFPTASSTVTVQPSGGACSNPSVKIDLTGASPAVKVIPVNKGSYPITLNFNSNGNFKVNPLVQLCIKYRRNSTGDILTCTIYPNSQACSVNAPNPCQ
jgi:type II secretory pathway pseudopilin PulG